MGWWDQLFGINTSFKAYTLAHYLPLLIFSVLLWLWIYFSKNWSYKSCKTSAFLAAIFLEVLVVFHVCVRLCSDDFKAATDLPFHLCNLLTFIVPIALLVNRSWLNGVLYFWILVGTFQALLTPDLKEGFPHYIYFRFWTVHAGLVMIVLFSLARLNWKIEFKHILYAGLFANIFIGLSFVINYMTGGNYFYSVHKPKAATILDYLGEWPWYLLWGQLVMMGLFAIYYIPIHFYNKYQKK